MGKTREVVLLASPTSSHSALLSFSEEYHICDIITTVVLDKGKITAFELQDFYTKQITAYTEIFNIIKKHISNNELTQFNETTAKKVTYKNLVFKGGGPKGIVYVGALVKLVELWANNEELKDLKSIERVAGTSAGAITAALLAIGYTPQETYTLLLKRENHPKQFLENQPLGALSSKPWHTKLAEAAKAGGHYALHPLQFGNLFFNLAKEDCLCTGDVFLNWIEGHIRTAIKQLTGKELPWCTFGELKELIDNQKERKFRHLHLVTVQVNPHTNIEVISSEDSAYKNYTIAHAIRASMSIPVLFAPAQLHQLVIGADGSRKTDPVSNAHYIDGGVLANYPLKLFDKERYVHQQRYFFRNVQQKDFPVHNEETLGFYILPEKPTEDPIYTVDAGKLAMWRAVNHLYSSAQDQTHHFEQNDRRSIPIGNAGITLYDFDLTEKQLNDLYQEGVKAVANSPLVKAHDTVKSQETKEPNANLINQVGQNTNSPLHAKNDPSVHAHSQPELKQEIREERGENTVKKNQP